MVIAEDGQGLEMEELQAAHAAELQRLRAEHQVRQDEFMAGDETQNGMIGI